MSDDFIQSGLPGYGSCDLTPGDIDYLSRYWLSLDELANKWSFILDSSFVRLSKGISIEPGRVVDMRRGGLLFDEPEFALFVKDANKLGARRFAVIEDIGQSDWVANVDRSFFRFSYPLAIPWEDMTRSCPLAEDVFLRPIRCFFVVLDNGIIGKYVNSDAEIPYEMVFKL